MNVYYIVHPNGREKLPSTNRTEALNDFRNHWTSTSDWISGKKPLVRRLIETTSEEIHAEPISKARQL
jgi:hypothetical protein